MSVSYILLPLEILLVVIQSSASKYSSCWLNTEGQSWGLLRVKSMCEPLAQTSSFINGLCTSIVICLGGNFVLNSCFRKSIRLAQISFLRVGFIPVLLGQLASPCCDRLSGEHRTAPYLQGSGEWRCCCYHCASSMTGSSHCWDSEGSPTSILLSRLKKACAFLD